MEWDKKTERNNVSTVFGTAHVFVSFLYCVLLSKFFKYWIWKTMKTWSKTVIHSASTVCVYIVWKWATFYFSISCMNYDNIFLLNVFFSVKCFLSVYLLPIRFDLSIFLHIGDIRFVFLALYDIVRINHNLIEPNDENKIHDKKKHTETETETETKRNEMYTWLLLIQYHSDHNLWKFVFFLICLLFGQCRKQKNKWKLLCFFVADVLLLSLSTTTIINSFKLTVNYIFSIDVPNAHTHTQKKVAV